VGFTSSGLSAIGRLAAIALLAAAFLFGLAGVVYMSLQGSEVQVPEITGKPFSESEKELAMLGLKIKKRADRSSSEAPNTVIEQLPKPGETVKTGQLILVVTSKGLAEGEEKTPIKKGIDEDDAETIEEMIDDKPKKAKSNSNVNRKKADTTRDVSANAPDGGSNSNESNLNKKESNNNSTEKQNKNTQPAPKPPNPAARPAEGRPRQQ
jgi:beta-lactam-binding protein with PASTA domain